TDAPRPAFLYRSPRSPDRQTSIDLLALLTCWRVAGRGSRAPRPAGRCPGRFSHQDRPGDQGPCMERPVVSAPRAARPSAVQRDLSVSIHGCGLVSTDLGVRTGGRAARRYATGHSWVGMIWGPGGPVRVVRVTLATVEMRAVAAEGRSRRTNGRRLETCFADRQCGNIVHGLPATGAWRLLSPRSGSRPDPAAPRRAALKRSYSPLHSSNRSRARR